MKFYGIEMAGRLNLQKVDNLPSFDSSRDEARIVYNTNDGLTYSGNASRNEWEPTRDIEPGTKMIFKQGSAPSGWTFQSEDNDRVLMSTSTESDGGTTGGDWTISGISTNGNKTGLSINSNTTGLSIDGSSTGGSVSGHTLSENELPSISGEMQIRSNVSVYDGNNDHTVLNVHDHFSRSSGRKLAPLRKGDPDNYSMDKITFAFGGDQAHSHGFSGDHHSHGTSESPHSHGTSESNHSHSVDHDGNWRPNYAKVITCTKN